MYMYMYICSSFYCRFWEKDENRRFEAYTSHEDINEIMRAVSLFPEALLTSEAKEVQGK